MGAVLSTQANARQKGHGSMDACHKLLGIGGRWYNARLDSDPALPCHPRSRKGDQPAAQHGPQLLLPEGHVSEALPR